MAIVDSIVEKVANTSVMKKAIDKAVENLKVNDVNEYASLSRLQGALTKDIGKQSSVYLEIFRLEELDFDYSHFNSAGWYHRDLLSFHNHYLATPVLNTTLTNRANKIVQENTLLGKEEIDNAVFRDIQMLLDVYSKCLLFTKVKAEKFEDCEFQLIEPYRYHVNNGLISVYTYLGHDDKEALTYKETYQDGNKIISHTKKQNKKGDIEIIESEEEIIEHIAFYEFAYKTEPKLKAIKTKIALLDLLETARAVELKNSQFSVHADERYFEDGKIVVSDFYRIYSGVVSEGNAPMFTPFQPELRQESYRNLENSYKEDIATALSMSTRALGVANTEVLTATGELLLEESTIQTINADKNKLEKLLNVYLTDIFGLTLVIPDYISDNIGLRASVVQTLGANVSIEAKVGLLFPKKSEEEKMREVVLIKLEQGIVMTQTEIDFANKEKLIGVNFDNVGA